MQNLVTLHLWLLKNPNTQVRIHCLDCSRFSTLKPLITEKTKKLLFSSYEQWCLLNHDNQNHFRVYWNHSNASVKKYWLTCFPLRYSSFQNREKICLSTDLLEWSRTNSIFEHDFEVERRYYYTALFRNSSSKHHSATRSGCQVFSINS